MIKTVSEIMLHESIEDMYNQLVQNITSIYLEPKVTLQGRYLPFSERW